LIYSTRVVLALHKIQEFCTETNDLKLRFRLHRQQECCSCSPTYQQRRKASKASKKIAEILDKIACFSGRKLSRATQRKDKFRDERERVVATKERERGSAINPEEERVTESRRNFSQK
jgi:DNA replication protein DnaD